MDRRVSLRIRYDQRSGLVGLLALALLVAALLGYLAWGQREVVASGLQAPLDHPFDLAQGRAQDRPFDRAQDKPLASSAGLRGYYLTESTYNGADADGTDGNGAGVCAEGYHFASLWEILDPSNLKYNTDLGATLGDSGQGPPSYWRGWVRTGYYNTTTTTVAGHANCNAWTSSSDSDSGTYAVLPDYWTTGQDVHVWEVSASKCYMTRRVWCVADKVSTPVYLPIILKNSS
jgi:hypothetical protein